MTDDTELQSFFDDLDCIMPGKRKATCNEFRDLVETAYLSCASAASHAPLATGPSDNGVWNRSSALYRPNHDHDHDYEKRDTQSGCSVSNGEPDIHRQTTRLLQSLDDELEGLVLAHQLYAHTRPSGAFAFLEQETEGCIEQLQRMGDHASSWGLQSTSADLYAVAKSLTDSRRWFFSREGMSQRELDKDERYDSDIEEKFGRFADKVDQQSADAERGKNDAWY